MLSTRICGQIGVVGDQDGRDDDPEFLALSVRVALKMEKEADSIERMMRLQLKLTPRRANLAMRTRVLIFRSRFCSFSVLASRFSRISSSRKVGLSGFSLRRPGVPGTFMALLSGDRGVMGTWTDSRLLM